MEIELNLERLLSIWWSFMWRAVVGGLLIGLVLGFIGGLLALLFGQPQIGPAVGGLMDWVGSIPVSVWALKASLSKKRAKYKIVLLGNSE